MGEGRKTAGNTSKGDRGHRAMGKGGVKGRKGEVGWSGTGHGL